jgi:putative ABC transport system substrate-binding protein
VTDFARELAGKRLELMKESVSKVSRLALLSWKPAGPDYVAERNDIETAARALRIELQPVEVGGANELEGAFAAMTKAGANSFTGLTDTRFANNRKRIIELVAKNRLPAVYQERAFAEAGGLMSYGTNRSEYRRRVAYYVDRILKGAKPADLPVEQPTKFELVINLKTAKQIGVAIPQSVLYRADRVIK